MTWEPPTEYREQLKELYGLECVPAWGTPRNLSRPTLGGKWAKVMTKLGTPPMPWQRYVADVTLEVDPITGFLFYIGAGFSVMRQQGKTAMDLGFMVHRQMAWKRQRIQYNAQTRGDARNRLEDEFKPMCEEAFGTGKTSRMQYRMSNGHEAFIWKPQRSLIVISSNTEKAGHGPPLDLGVIDESFAHEDDRVEQAMGPAMLTRRNAQLLWSSAGGTEKSLWLNKKRSAGRLLIENYWRTGRENRVAYFEFFAPEDMDRADPATWHAVMPAMCPDPICHCDPEGVWYHTCFEASVQGSLENMDPAEFDRAYLNRTRKFVPPQDPNVPRADWRECVDKEATPDLDLLAFAIDVSPQRDWASIGLASFTLDGRVYVELIDRRKGVDWVVPAIVKLKELWMPVAVGVDPKGPAGALIPALKEAGIDVPEDPEEPQRGDLFLCDFTQAVIACGQMVDHIKQHSLVHRDQVWLTAALNGARTRTAVDAFLWARIATLNTNQVDISPLVATTVAVRTLKARADAVSALPYDPVANIG